MVQKTKTLSLCSIKKLFKLRFNKLGIFISLLLFSCTTTKKENVEANTIKIDTTRLTSSQIESNLKAKGFKTFSYVDETTKDTVIMQQYFIAFLKSGSNRNQTEEEAKLLQDQHLAHLGLSLIHI